MVMFIDDREPIYCPDCGGQPTIKPTMWDMRIMQSVLCVGGPEEE